MSCEEIRNLALLASFGEAARDEEARVREHSAACPACAAEIRALREGIEVLKNAPRETPSRDTREAIGGMLLREAPRRAAARPGLRYAAAAALLLACGAGMLIWKWPRAAVPGLAGPVTAGVTEKAPAPAPDPLLAWNAEEHASIDDITTSLATLAPAPEARDANLEWFETDATRESLADIDDRLDSIYAEIDKL